VEEEVIIMNRYKPIGWRFHSTEHSLARRGIKTKIPTESFKVVGAIKNPDNLTNSERVSKWKSNMRGLAKEINEMMSRRSYSSKNVRQDLKRNDEIIENSSLSVSEKKEIRKYFYDKLSEYRDESNSKSLGAEGIALDDPRKYKFGTVAWQDAMVHNIRAKLKHGEELGGMEKSFLEVQGEHIKRIDKKGSLYAKGCETFKFKGGSTPDSFFDEHSLETGTLVETEHIDNRDVAKQIAKGHLLENPNYYSAKKWKKEAQIARKRLPKNFLGAKGFRYGEVAIGIRKKKKGVYDITLKNAITGEKIHSDTIYGDYRDINYFVKTRFDRYGKRISK
jgi:hypothetical protein